MARRQKPVAPRKLGPPPPERRRYRILVGGKQRFHGTNPGDTVDLDLTEAELAIHILSGVAASHELLDEVEEAVAEEPPKPHRDDARNEVLRISDSAFVSMEAGPEPEHE